MRLIFFGPPGSGKGTQAKLIANQFNITHLSTGDILREKLKGKDDLSNQLKEIMSSGHLVSDDILNKIVAEKILSSDCSDGFILDGYPRTLPQATYLLSFLNKNNIKLNCVIDFKIDFNIVEKRIILRSKQEKRSDDNLNVIKTRLSKYMQETYPVSISFKDKFLGKFHSIDASQEISQIQKELIKILKKAQK